MVEEKFKKIGSIYADRILDANRVITGDSTGGKILIHEDRIAAIAPLAHTEPRLPRTLVMPGLANAHDHGRGLRRVDYGAADDALEIWLPQLAATHPTVDPYTAHVVAFARMVLGGVTTAVHCHVPINLDNAVKEAETVCHAARTVGLRIAFVVPMRNQNYLAYGGDERFLQDLPEPDRSLARKYWIQEPKGVQEQLDLVDAIASVCEGQLATVQFGPYGDCWVSRPMIEAIAARSAQTGRRIHMHTLETIYQRQWIDHNFPAGYFRYLDEVGFLSPRLTLAHGVWLRPDECELLAKRGVTLSLNTCSNLRLRSGIAPVADFFDANLKFGIGMDGMAIDDDAMQEIRLAHMVHAGLGLDQVMTANRLFTAATIHGSGAVDGRRHVGLILDGHAADLVILDYDSLSENVVSHGVRDSDIVLSRATRHHVRSVIIAGKEVARNGQIPGLDLDAMILALHEEARLDEAPRTAMPLVQRVQSALRAYYRRSGHLETTQ